MEECGFRHIKALISLKRGKVGPKLLSLLLYEVLYALSIVPTLTTLDDFEGLLCTPFA